MVNQYKLKLTSLQREILETLCINTGNFLSKRDLSKVLFVSPPAITKALPKLEKEKLITINLDKSKRSEIKLNFENHKVLNIKRIFNLNSIYTSGLFELLEKEFPGGTIILFGSYSRGEDTIKSDIDIAIIGRKEKNIPLEKYEKILEREIILQFYDSFSKIHKDLRENIINGVVYSGGIELWNQ